MWRKCDAFADPAILNVSRTAFDITALADFSSLFFTIGNRWNFLKVFPFSLFFLLDLININ